jgi:hypothetical protein
MMVKNSVANNRLLSFWKLCQVFLRRCLSDFNFVVSIFREEEFVQMLKLKKTSSSGEC